MRKWKIPSTEGSVCVTTETRHLAEGSVCVRDRQSANALHKLASIHTRLNGNTVRHCSCVVTFPAACTLS